MGVVYLARDTHLNRAVAIKVLPADKIADPERRRRFAQEARAASALNHPNIVTIYDIRSDAGTDFIVMEHVSGRTLDAAVGARPMRVERVLRYGVQIADALAKAHAAGIVHRDLKPSNILVTDADTVKVVDFGLAKLVEPDRTGDAETRSVPLTEGGMIVGTAAYMSPEQAEGRAVDGRSDIFSFGAILYEMVTGRRAFEGTSMVSVLAKIINEDPPSPSGSGHPIPMDVERAVLRCLRKDPARRFQTMADLKVALEDLAVDSGTVSAGTPRAIRTRRWVPAAVVALIAAASGGGYVAWKTLAPIRSSAGNARAVPLTALPGMVRYPSFSPDGNQLVFTWNGRQEDNADLYVQQIGAGEPLRITKDAAPDTAPVWSPDGRTVAFLRLRPDGPAELRTIAPLGGTERRIAEIQPRGFLREMTLDWCPDSTCVIVTDHSGPSPSDPGALFVVSLDSGQKRQLTTPPKDLLGDTDPAISPDGKWIVFRRDLAPYSGRLQIASLGPGLTSTGEPRPLTTILITAYGPRWISDDEIVFGAKGALWRLHVAPGSIPERLAFAGEDGIMPAVSRATAGRAARLAYIRSYRDTNIWRLDTPGPGLPATTPPVKVLASTRRDQLAQLSPDGKRVSFLSDRSGEYEVWSADLDGANAIQLTALAANPGFPRWSPDGNLIAFHSNTEEGPAGDVFVVPASGGKPRKLTSHRATDTFPSFSGDRRWVYFSTKREGEAGVWKVPADGGDAVRVTSRRGYTAIESADAQALYFVDAPSSTLPGALWRLPASGGEATRLIEKVMAVGFDVIDRGIYFFEGQASGVLKFWDFKTQRTSLVAEGLTTTSAGMSVSRDGRIILFTRLDTRVDDLMLIDNFR